MILLLVVGAAALVRAAPYLQRSVLTSPREYDEAVMLVGSLRLLAGRLPYGEFVFLHPPGSLVALLPASALHLVADESFSLGVARVSIIGLGAVSTLLVGLLLWDRGWLAVLTGAGVYATWGPIASTERTVFLEPGLNCCLLLALWLSRKPARAGPVTAAGIALGIACSVKYWAVVDTTVVLVLVAVTAGWAYAGRFVLGRRARSRNDGRTLLRSRPRADVAADGAQSAVPTRDRRLGLRSSPLLLPDPGVRGAGPSRALGRVPPAARGGPGPERASVGQGRRVPDPAPAPGPWSCGGVC